MKDDEVFWLRLYVQSANTVATLIAAGEVQFQVLSETMAHDLASFALLVAAVSNIFLLGLATQRSPREALHGTPNAADSKNTVQGQDKLR